MNKVACGSILLLFLLSAISCVPSKRIKPKIWECESQSQEENRLADRLEQLRKEERGLQETIELLRQQKSTNPPQIDSFLKEQKALHAEIDKMGAKQGHQRACRGYIEIRSEPSEAAIFIDGEQKTHKTSAKFRASCGHHTVEVRKNGCTYHDNPRKVLVGRDKTRRAHFESE